jgi:hypothetical protein
MPMHTDFPSQYHRALPHLLVLEHICPQNSDGGQTHMHVHNHAISLASAYSGRNNDQRIPIDEVAHTALIFRAVARVGEEVEFQGCCDRRKQECEEDE